MQPAIYDKQLVLWDAARRAAQQQWVTTSTTGNRLGPIRARIKDKELRFVSRHR